MLSQNLYEESGNLIMRGTNAHKHAKKSKKNNSKNMEKELKSMKKSELIKKFHEMLDPDHTEDVSGETKDEIIENLRRKIQMDAQLLENEKQAHNALAE